MPKNSLVPTVVTDKNGRVMTVHKKGWVAQHTPLKTVGLPKLTTDGSMFEYQESLVAALYKEAGADAHSHRVMKSIETMDERDCERAALILGSRSYDDMQETASIVINVLRLKDIRTADIPRVLDALEVITSQSPMHASLVYGFMHLVDQERRYKSVMHRGLSTSDDSMKHEILQLARALDELDEWGVQVDKDTLHYTAQYGLDIRDKDLKEALFKDASKAMTILEWYKLHESVDGYEESLSHHESLAEGAL